MLLSMTYMGPHTALLSAVEIGGISRFVTPRKMVSWPGLCPSVHQSGDGNYTGRIKKL